LRSDALGGFAHAEQAALGAPPRSDRLSVDSDAIIPHDNPQAVWQILKFGFDRGRPGMAKRVQQGFPNDQQDLFLNCGM
jgi:hypothetical protein